MSGAWDVDVQVETDCGNSPRKAQVRDWLVALASGDVDTVCGALAEDVVWESAGGETLSGLARVRPGVERLGDQHPTVLRIRRLVSHGKEVAAEGSWECAGTEAQFARFVTFAGHTARAVITSVVAFRRR